MSIFKSKDARTYAASGVFLILVIGLILFLTYIEVPSNNKDIIVTIIGMLVWGLGTAMSNLFWAADEELEFMKEEVRHLQSSYDKLEVRYQTLKKNYDAITERLVDRVEIWKKD